VVVAVAVAVAVAAAAVAIVAVVVVVGIVVVIVVVGGGREGLLKQYTEPISQAVLTVSLFFGRCGVQNGYVCHPSPLLRYSQKRAYP